MNGLPERCPRLAGVQEAAAIGGVSRQQVLNLRGRPEFPAPVQELACGTIWLASDLEEYFAVPRRPGRPRNGPAGGARGQSRAG